MKIAVIGVQGIPSNQGEIERYCQEFCPRIAARGHQVDLFIQPEYNQPSWFSVRYYHNVRVIALASFPHQQISLMLSSALSTIWASLGDYDVIHLQSTKAAWFSWFPQLFSGSKVIITSHQLDLGDRESKWGQVFGWLFSLMERSAIKNADEIVVVSKALGAYFQHKYNIQPRYIPNAPGTYNQKDLPDLQFSYDQSLGLKSKRYILYSGQLTPKNQPDLLLKAFQKLEPQGWKLVLAGGIGNSPQYVFKLLGLARENPNIVFTNEISGQHLAQITSNAGLLVVPSDGSDLGLPLAVLEAMREKIPVLASDNSVYQELIGKDRGLLFESGNLDSLVAKLQYALSEPAQLITMAQKAQTHILINHNWDRVTYGNLSLYLKLTAQMVSASVQHNI
jgi:glycosyltransferase involved in cell wall biosynthesis